MISLADASVIDFEAQGGSHRVQLKNGNYARRLESTITWAPCGLFAYSYSLRGVADGKDERPSITAHRLLALVCKHFGIKDWNSKIGQELLEDKPFITNWDSNRATKRRLWRWRKSSRRDHPTVTICWDDSSA